MKRATKQRIAVVGVITAILVTVGLPNYRHNRAQVRLSEIREGLRQIDSGAEQWCMESSYTKGLHVSRADLEQLGSPPDLPLPYVVWPHGPIPGTYAPTTCDDMATFDGGTNGALNRKEWETTCSTDPSVCGL